MSQVYLVWYRGWIVGDEVVSIHGSYAAAAGGAMSIMDRSVVELAAPDDWEWNSGCACWHNGIGHNVSIELHEVKE